MTEEELDVLELEARTALRDILANMLREIRAAEGPTVSLAEAVARLRDEHRVCWTDRDGVRRVSDE